MQQIQSFAGLEEWIPTLCLLNDLRGLRFHLSCISPGCNKGLFTYS